MTQLSASALELLRAEGLTGAAWSQLHFETDEWHGDVCGCSDDRCVGFHHDNELDCGCLPALLDRRRRDQEAAGLWARHLATEDGPDPALMEAVGSWVLRYFPRAETFAVDQPVHGRFGISITYPTNGLPVPEWATPAGEEAYRILVWVPPSSS